MWWWLNGGQTVLHVLTALQVAWLVVVAGLFALTGHHRRDRVPQPLPIREEQRHRAAA